MINDCHQHTIHNHIKFYLIDLFGSLMAKSVSTEMSQNRGGASMGVSPRGNKNYFLYDFIETFDSRKTVSKWLEGFSFYRKILFEEFITLVSSKSSIFSTFKHKLQQCCFPRWNSRKSSSYTAHVPLSIQSCGDYEVWGKDCKEENEDIHCSWCLVEVMYIAIFVELIKEPHSGTQEIWLTQHA